MKNSMRNNLLFAALLAMLGSSTTLIAQTTQTKEVSMEVAALAKAWQDAYNRRDHTTLASLYTQEVENVGQDGSTSTVTKLQIEEQFKSEFMAYNLQTEVKVGSVTLLPDGKAEVIGTYTTSAIDLKTGARMVETGTYDHELVKQAGAWKLTKIHVIPSK